ncbi:hypothetical protein EYF80_058221 [Liparis tanakae]|uniref:Uncharacterized protein n=1 Tax=Liparis tanakae TaxID=230148 RepID=A0A4Z2ETM5_9TELE|nr:hypothetical protein EYF80_058221 [Liparis tanakae]
MQRLRSALTGSERHEDTAWKTSCTKTRRGRRAARRHGVEDELHEDTAWKTSCTKTSCTKTSCTKTQRGRRAARRRAARRPFKPTTRFCCQKRAPSEAAQAPPTTSSDRLAERQR